MSAALLTCILVAAQAPPTAPEAEPVAPTDAAAARPLPLVLDVVGVDAEQMASAVGLRLRDRPLLAPHEFGPDDRVDYAAVRRLDDGALAITLITADGRAYDRTLPPEQVQSVRAVAGVLANLVYATEAGETQPDRTEVPIPPPKTVEPAPAKPEPPVPAPAKPEPPAKVAPEPPVEPAPRRRWELGLAPSGGVIVGIAPRTGGSALAAGHGALAIDVRAPIGALVSAGVRVGGRVQDPLALWRTRIELGAGWDVRRGRAEIAIVGAMSVELWRALADGRGVGLQVDGAAAQRPVVLGGFARISPGWYIAAKRSGAPSLRVGARVDIGGSAALGRGGHTIDIGTERPDGSRRGALRVGGLELAAGLEIVLWFGL